MKLSTIFILFIITWALFAIIGILLFYKSNNYYFKIKYFKYYIILLGLIFIIFIALFGFPNIVFIYAIPSVALISFLNIKYTNFCHNCGKTVINQIFFSHNNNCPYCGQHIK